MIMNYELLSVQLIQHLIDLYGVVTTASMLQQFPFNLNDEALVALGLDMTNNFIAYDEIGSNL